ncbi:cell wall hydrolase [Sphingomonas gei]|uniref:Cell wall hydrolase n=1 Tax=Sphingomonas gei TaxID=1395960 RepID=A0A4S1XG99_9SPHN|nr:cell wall hydrolase [Sphingomonas gei]TGX54733.1 cell wall hydrolase [Sphingomonas gei]
MQMRGVAAGAIVSLVGAGFSAHALSPDTPSTAPKPAATGYEADDHFPGAAFYTAVSDEAAVATGTTGTIALPDLPVPENAVIDSSIQPAAPFRLAGTAVDHVRALQCLTQAIYYEAASEPDDGQRAVAQVVLNRVRHPAFPATVCGVVFQGSEKRGCQFSFACDGAMARIPSRSAWARAERVAGAALAGSVFAPVGMATHYHTYAVTPSWNRGLVMTGMFGAHLFHRWKGWWGMAAAFRQPYQGGEPFPAPHLAAAPTAVAPLPVVASAGIAKAASVAVQPAYAESGAPVAAYAEATLPDSQILDKWKDSGKPLR